MVIDTEIFSKVDTVEEHEHVVERVDGNAEPADLTGGSRVVAIETHQRRQVKCGR